MLEGGIPRGAGYKVGVKIREVGVGYPGISLYLIIQL
jgi:hypothetical protein